ncbi:hypothetical protein EOT10_09735 [Streptomyces antnestii]|uniref:Uncharacterized protein n=1 Tax=Streptomyces antnestii TaxID=2494256 RepID=A0A3S2VJN2_9ACTN|nr:hypothetical protein [Streptomyces sp. San01]RVU27434.1 hypothetical protein EOT10_09735 [Streptomyces sp. San01]
MDLLDWYRGRLSSRRLAVLLRHLPRDSALAHSLHGEAAEWATTDHLLAAVVDQLAEANWMFATVNRDEDSNPLDPPQPIPRPGAEADPPATDAGPASEPMPSAERLVKFFI